MNKIQQARAERQKRGRGACASYVPYIQVRRGEFGSRGRSHIFPSPFYKRSHHLLSDLELHTLWLVLSSTPRDVREQFPLEWTYGRDNFNAGRPYALGTVEIASELGYKHPNFSKNDPMRMTTDLLVHHRDGEWAAYHVKYEADLGDPRNTELRKIEEAYWRERQVRFEVITEAHVSRTAISSLAMAHTFDRDSLFLVSRPWAETLVTSAQEHSMHDVTKILAQRFGRTPSAHGNVVKYAIATGVFHLDLTFRQLDWFDVWPAISIRALQP
jgi:hypothetical protein